MKQEIGGHRATGKADHGGDMSVNLHGFRKSNANLDKRVFATVAPGVAFPVYKRIFTKESGFDMNIRHYIQTYPPEFQPWGAFEMRVRYYSVDPRLYIRKLHNNLGKLGRNPEQVYFPGIRVTGVNPAKGGEELNQKQINPASLLHHLGYVGLGHNQDGDAETLMRVFGNAIPILAYYDIIKNDYCNWQEDDAYVITTGLPDGREPSTLNMVSMVYNPGAGPMQMTFLSGVLSPRPSYENEMMTQDTDNWTNENGGAIAPAQPIPVGTRFIFHGQGTFGTTVRIQKRSPDDFWPATGYPIENFFTRVVDPGIAGEVWEVTEVTKKKAGSNINWMLNFDSADGYYFTWNYEGAAVEGLRIVPFPLSNIDRMREDLLGAPSSSPVVIEQGGFGDYLPYSTLTNTRAGVTETIYPNTQAMNGMMLVTYKSDLLNNWMDKEFIEGDNGIAAMTAIDVSAGTLAMDTLLAAKTIYNQQNRIAASKGDWRAYEEVMYGGSSSMYAETPMYIGGMSADIYFEEQLAMAESSAEGLPGQLGFIGGVGRTGSSRNGHIRFKSKSTFSYVIGILTIVPKALTYTQGNDFDVDFGNMTDIHTPTLDGLGFQDLPTDWKAAWDTAVDENGMPIKYSSGKQPAFIEWRTDVDRAHGLFCNQNDLQGRILGRRYTPDSETNRLSDDTTYIDPRKFNQIFKYTDLDAMNFQVLITHDVNARHNGGASQIPNL